MEIDVHIDDGPPAPHKVGDGKVSPVDTCLFWRSARSVLNEGHTASENVVVCVDGRGGERYPLMILTLTRARRLICWPVFPDRVCSPDEEQQLRLVDHVTLELGNRQSHSTAYGGHSQKLPTAHQWKLRRFPCNGVSFWFGFAVRLVAIENQILSRHQWIRFPKPDAERRKAEYVRFFERLRLVNANRPRDDGLPGNALIGYIYLVDGPKVSLSPELCEPQHWPDEFWEALPGQERFNVLSTGFAVDSVQLGLLLGVPPVQLREDGPILFTPREE